MASENTLTYPLVNPLNKLVGVYKFRSLYSPTINDSGDGSSFVSPKTETYSSPVLESDATISLGNSLCYGTQYINIGGTTSVTGTEVIELGATAHTVGTTEIAIGKADTVITLKEQTIPTGALNNISSIDQDLDTTSSPTFNNVTATSAYMIDGYERVFIPITQCNAYLDDVPATGFPIAPTTYASNDHKAFPCPVDAFANFTVGGMPHRFTAAVNPSIYAYLFSTSTEENEIQFSVQEAKFESTGSVSEPPISTNQTISTLANSCTRLLLKSGSDSGSGLTFFGATSFAIQRIAASGTEYTGNLWLMGFELVYHIDRVKVQTASDL